MKIIKDIQNPLLKRRELEIFYEGYANPGFEKFANELPQMLKVAPENLIIKKVKGKFGSGQFIASAFVYEDAKHKELIEPKKKTKSKAATAANKEKA